MNAAKQPIIFTVVGGFLGAGKTSLVNRILAAGGPARFAVLVNDFGALNIDESLILSQTGKIMKLANGCICCSLAGGLVDAMLELTKYYDHLDHILIEASGVSNPSRIMDFARIDGELRPGLTIVLVDLVHFEEQLDNKLLAETIEAQIESADLFLLTKSDLVSVTHLDHVTAILTDRQPLVPVVTLDQQQEDFASFLVFDDTALPTISKPAGHHHDDQLLHSFHSIAMACDLPIDRARFSAIVKEHSARILRGKGMVNFANSLPEDGHSIWQQTGRLIEITTVPSPDNTPDISGTSRIIAISTDDLAPLEDAFRTLGFTPAPNI